MKLMFAALIALTIPGLGQAQNGTREFSYDGLGYGFASLGACQHQYFSAGAGGGGEGFLWKGLSLGGELGVYSFPNDRSSGYGVAVLGPSYHFVDRKKPTKWDPYVTAKILGIGFANGGVAGAAVLGGGVNYWFKERIGIQTGVQVHAIAEETVVSFRAGVTFR
jgi:hypothetical protein